MSVFERVFESEQLVHAPLEKVFEFFSHAGNLERITPPSLGFRILTPLPIDMRSGTLIDYRISLHGIPLRWRTEILDWNPPHSFVDVQLRGPYKLWHHTHSFERVSDSVTRMRDRVRYQAPFGPLGLLVVPLFVAPEVGRIFAFRTRAIEEIFPLAGKT
jgi:ligand-binding SRPBCC domain-containing protein